MADDEAYTYDIDVVGTSDEVVIKEAEVVTIDVDNIDVDVGGIELDVGTELVRDKLAVGKEADVSVKVTIGVKLENVLLVKLKIGGTDVSTGLELLEATGGNCRSTKGIL